MTTMSALDHLEENVFPGIEDLDFKPRKSLKPEDFDSYDVKPDTQLLTDQPEEIRSYDIELDDFSFGLSAETGFYQGNYSIGISTEIKNESVQELLTEIAEAYRTDIETLDHGDYILDLSEW